MPYPNEHAARVKEPIESGFGDFARKQIAPGISIILQKKKNSDEPLTVQAYRFSKTTHTADEARKWLRDHKIGYISFDPATE